MAYADTIRTSNADLEDVADLLDDLNDTKIANLNQGWTLMSESHTYASSSTITVATGAASRYQLGDKVKLTNSTVKYFYITTIADTLLTVNGGSDYSLSNTTISSVYISRASRPFGFPARHNFTQNLGGFSAVPTQSVATFCIDQGHAIVDLYQNNTGTSNATTFTMNAPVQAATVSNGAWVVVGCLASNNGALQTAPPIAVIASAGTTISLYLNASAAAWTNTNGKAASFGGLRYPIAGIT